MKRRSIRNVSVHEWARRVSRKKFLTASATALAGLSGHPTVVSRVSEEAVSIETRNGRARSTILFFLCGGASQIDTWDMKPSAPAEIRGEFQPILTSAPEIQLCEHLPLTARQAHHLAVIRSVDGTDPTNSHLGYYRQLTGHELDPATIRVPAERRQQLDDWPFIGSVVSAKLPRKSGLPGAISYPWIPEGPPDIRAGQFAGKLGIEHDPLYLFANPQSPMHFQAPALTLDEQTTVEKLLNRRVLLDELGETRRRIDAHQHAELWQQQHDRAFSLLTSLAAADAFDLTKEPESLRHRYGMTINGMGLLLARRLVEAGVPFITVYWMPDKARAEELRCSSAGGWDTHGNNFQCLREMLLPEFDRGFSALLEDLSDRGLLETTLVLVTSEMGRQPRIGDPRSGGVTGAGRDHWTYCMTDLLAGGGIRGGQVFGSSDRYGEYPLEKRVTPADIAKTIYHSMGIRDLSAVDKQNRPWNIQEDGRPLLELF